MFMSAPENAGAFVEDAGLFAPGIRNVEVAGETGQIIMNLMPDDTQELLEMVNRDPGCVLLTLAGRELNTRLFQQYITGRLTTDQLIQQLKSNTDRIVRQLIDENDWDLSEYLD